MPTRSKLAFLPLVLLVVPLVEIALFVTVGREIGLWWTLGLVLLTAVIGTTLLRIQGVRTFRNIQAESQAGRVPGRQLVHAFLLLIAGILLLTPGFFTDAIGFTLFVPAVRDGAWSLLKTRLVAGAATMMPGGMGMGGGMSGMGPGSGMGGSPFGRPASEPGVVDLGEGDYEVRREPQNPPRS